MSEHPFFVTWTAQRHASTDEVCSADGVFITMADGRQFLDLASLSYQANLGHGDTHVVEAIREQALALCTASPRAVFPAKQRAAHMLLALCPADFSRVFFTLGGAEANENALKMASLLTGRTRFLSRKRSYHGATLGALSVTGDWRRAAFEGLLLDTLQADDCYCDRCPFSKQVATCDRECASQIAEQVSRRDIAAVILEVIPGANGVLLPPPDYLAQIRKACDDTGTLLIFDEVLTGFGRTGTCFAFEHYDVTPDMITVAKALTGGYAPLGAVIVNDAIATHFEDEVLPAGLTAYAYPLGCAAAVAALERYRDGDLFRRAHDLGARLRAWLGEFHQRFDRVEYTRSLGLLAVAEIANLSACSVALSRALADEGVVIHAYPERNSIVLSPPLTISESELDDGLSRVSRALERVL